MCGPLNGEAQSSRKGSNWGSCIGIRNRSSSHSLYLDLIIGTSTNGLTTNDNHTITFLGNTSFNSTLTNHGSQSSCVFKRLDNVGVNTFVEATCLTSNRFVRSQANDVTTRTMVWEGWNMGQCCNSKA